MLSTIDLPRTPRHYQRLGIAVSVLAAIETGIALIQSLKLVAPNEPIVSGVSTAHLIVAPILAVAALVFAARDRLPQAIMALAALALTTWASELNAAPFAGSALIAANVVRPVVAIVAIVLAVRGKWLGLAAFLVASVWLVWAWVSFLSDAVIFAIGVIIYGV